eukprot:2952734-Karenia_brevis.AAC.1
MARQNAVGYIQNFLIGHLPVEKGWLNSKDHSDAFLLKGVEFGSVSFVQSRRLKAICHFTTYSRIVDVEFFPG